MTNTELTTQEPAVRRFFNTRTPVTDVTYSGQLAWAASGLGFWLQSLIASLPADARNGEVMPCDLTPQEMRLRICALEAAMFKGQEDGSLATLDIDKDLPLTHRFAPGAYAREMFVPKGSVVIGKIHKHAHLNFVMKGKALILTEDGPMMIEAPFTLVSKAGTKRLAVAIEDLVWTTVHVTEETDLERIEEQVIAKSYDDLIALETNPKEKLV